MIRITRFDGTQVVVNSDIIQTVEETPDTIVTLTTGDKMMIKETVDEVIQGVIEYKRSVFAGGLKLLRDDNIDYIE